MNLSVGNSRINRSTIFSGYINIISYFFVGCKIYVDNGKAAEHKHCDRRRHGNGIRLHRNVGHGGKNLHLAGEKPEKKPCDQQSDKTVQHSRKPKAFHRHTYTFYIRKKLKMHGEARPAQNGSDEKYGELRCGKGTAACYLGEENQHVEQRTDFCKIKQKAAEARKEKYPSADIQH